MKTQRVFSYIPPAQLSLVLILQNQLKVNANTLAFKYSTLSQTPLHTPKTPQQSSLEIASSSDILVDPRKWSETEQIEIQRVKCWEDLYVCQNQYVSLRECVCLLRTPVSSLCPSYLSYSILPPLRYLPFFHVKVNTGYMYLLCRGG